MWEAQLVLKRTRSWERSCCATPGEAPDSGNASSDTRGQGGLQLLCSAITSGQRWGMSWCFPASAESELQGMYLRWQLSWSVDQLKNIPIFYPQNWLCIPLWAPEMSQLGSLVFLHPWQWGKLLFLPSFFVCFNSWEEDNTQHLCLNARVMEGLSTIKWCQDKDTLNHAPQSLKTAVSQSSGDREGFIKMISLAQEPVL